MNTDDLARAERWHHALMAELGPPPETLRIALAKARRVLDVGCREGSWVVEQASSHRGKEFFGVDHDRADVRMAANVGIARGLGRAIFWQQDDYTELDPAICERESFGFVRASFLTRALLTTNFPKLAKSLYGVTAPGGVIGWTELELPITSSSALQHMFALLCRALDAVGQRYAPPTKLEIMMQQRRAEPGIKAGPRTHLGITPYLAYWLASAGCCDVHYAAHACDVSAYNHVVHTAFCEQTVIFMQAIQPLLFDANVVEEQAYAQLIDAVEAEIADLRFCGIIFGVTACGLKPR